MYKNLFHYILFDQQTVSFHLKIPLQPDVLYGCTDKDFKISRFQYKIHRCIPQLQIILLQHQRNLPAFSGIQFNLGKASQSLHRSCHTADLVTDIKQHHFRTLYISCILQHTAHQYLPFRCHVILYRPVVGGNVTDKRPEGLTSPNRIREIASPPFSPGYQASNTASTFFISSGMV